MDSMFHMFVHRAPHVTNDKFVLTQIRTQATIARIYPDELILINEAHDELINNIALQLPAHHWVVPPEWTITKMMDTTHPDLVLVLQDQGWYDALPTHIEKVFA